MYSNIFIIKKIPLIFFFACPCTSVSNVYNTKSKPIQCSYCVLYCVVTAYVPGFLCHCGHLYARWSCRVFVSLCRSLLRSWGSDRWTSSHLPVVHACWRYQGLYAASAGTLLKLAMAALTTTSPATCLLMVTSCGTKRKLRFDEPNLRGVKTSARACNLLSTEIDFENDRFQVIYFIY